MTKSRRHTIDVGEHDKLGELLLAVIDDVGKLHPLTRFDVREAVIDLTMAYMNQADPAQGLVAIGEFHLALSNRLAKNTLCITERDGQIVPCDDAGQPMTPQ